MSTYFEEVQEIKEQYPNWRSATLPALRLAQERHGYLSPEALRECADALGTTPALMAGGRQAVTARRLALHLRRIALARRCRYRNAATRYGRRAAARPAMIVA